VKPEGDKVMRLHASSTVIENGFVWVLREAHWLDAYLHELTTFPASKHSDQVDSTSQALAWMGTAAALDPEALEIALRESAEFVEHLAEERKRFFDQGLAVRGTAGW
jgi:hypothetical protein